MVGLLRIRRTIAPDYWIVALCLTYALSTQNECTRIHKKEEVFPEGMKIDRNPLSSGPVARN